MSVNARWRENPFTGDMNDILIEDEEHTIEYITELNIYGFYANEGVVLDPAEPVILVQDNTAQTTFTEQPRTIAPNAGQFRVDYDAEDYYNTGLVQCNAADNGKAVLFTYRGTGTIVHPSFRLQTQFNLPGNLSVEGTTTLDGDVTLAALTGSTISASNKKIEDVATPTTAGDAVSLGYFQTNLAHFEYFTANGSFVVPDGVTEILAEIAGGGGGGGGGFNNGAGSLAGGGGGGQSRDIAKYTVTPGETISITIGAGGTAGVGGTAAPPVTSGGTGGSTVFGSYATITGGTGGIGGGLTNSGKGGDRAGNAAQDGFNSGGIVDGSGGNGGGNGGRGDKTGAMGGGRAGVLGGGGGGGGASGGAAYSSAGAGGDGYVKIWW